MVEKKKCNDCTRSKPLDLFQRKKGGSQGRDSYCKQCKKRRQAKYLAVYLADPVKHARYKTSQTEWTKADPARAKRHGHATWMRLRNEMLDTYGRKCSCCSETHVEFLTLEHVNRDGSAHRKRVGGGANTYRDLRRRGWPKKGYTVLCMNCNWAVRRGGICPHKKKRR